MENINIVFQRIIHRERAKGQNFTVDDLYKSPLEHQQTLSIAFLVALVFSCVTGVIGNTLVSRLAEIRGHVLRSVFDSIYYNYIMIFSLCKNRAISVKCDIHVP